MHVRAWQCDVPAAASTLLRHQLYSGRLGEWAMHECRRVCGRGQPRLLWDVLHPVGQGKWGCANVAWEGAAVAATQTAFWIDAYDCLCRLDSMPASFWRPPHPFPPNTFLFLPFLLSVNGRTETAHIS